MGDKIRISGNVKEGIRDGIPLMVGFVPIGMAFGILGKAVGIKMIEALFFSAFVFAGSSQFIALNLILIGAGTGEIILTTLMVNFRHFLMGAALTTKITEEIKKWRFLIAFGITDEIFSILSFKKGKLSTGYVVSVQLVAYSSWVSGTLAGFLLGGVLPDIVTASMSMGLYAMFVVLLIPEIKKTFSVLILVILSGVMNTVCMEIFSLPQGWSIVISIILVSLVGVRILDEKDESEENI